MKQLLFSLLFVFSLAFSYAQTSSSNINIGQTYSANISTSCLGSNCSNNSFTVTWTISYTGDYTVSHPDFSGSYNGNQTFTTTTTNPCSNMDITLDTCGTATVTASAGCGTRTHILNVSEAEPTSWAGSNVYQTPSPGCSGSPVDLYVSNIAPAPGSRAASSGQAYDTVWYTGGCGGSQVHIGGTYTVTSPVNGTVYYVRLEPVGAGCGSNSSCKQITLNITSIGSPSGGTGGYPNICKGDTYTFPTLTCSTGSLVWYENSSGTGTSHTGSVSPTSSTVYYPFCESGSCQSSAGPSYTVTVINMPTPTSATSNVPSVCISGSASLSGSCSSGNVRWFTNSSGTGSAIQGGNPSPTVSVSTGNNVFYAFCHNSTYDCLSDGNIAVTVNVETPPANPAPISGGGNVCYGSNVTLTSSCVTGTVIWYATGCGVSTVGTGNTKVVSNVTSQVKYYAKCYNSSNTGSCQYSVDCDSVTLTPVSVAAPTGTGGDGDFCSGGSFTFPARTCATGTLRWYANSSGSGSFYTTSVNPPATSVYYPFCYDAPCLSTAGTSVTASEVDPPSAPTSLSSTTNNDCPGYSTTLSATCATGTVRWFASASDTGAGIGSSHTITANTTYYAKCYDGTVLPECRFSNASSISLTVGGPAPTASITKVTSSPCTDFSQCFSTPTVAGATYQWSVVPSNFIQNATTNYACIPFSTGGIKKVYVDVTYNGCTSTDSLTFDMADTIKANISMTSSTKCENQPICFSSNNFEVSVQYSWSATGSPVVDTTTPRSPCFTWSTAGTYTITMIAYTGSCSTTDTYTVVVDPIPTAAISLTSTDTCVGSSVCLTTPAVSGATYTWTASGASPSSSTSQSPCFTWTASGVKTVYLEVSNNGCVGYDTIQLTIVDAPNAPTTLAASPNSGCAPLSVSLSGNCGSGTLRWYTSASGTGTGLSASQSVSATTTFYGRCFDSGISASCQYSSANSVTVTIDDPGAPNPITSNPVTPSVCSGDSIQFTASCATGTLKWFDGVAPGGSLLKVGGSYTVQATAPGNYTLYAYCESAGGCLSPQYDSVDYTVNSIPQSPTGATASPSTICAGSSSTLTASGCAGGTIEWYDNASGTGTPLGTTSVSVSPSITRNYYAYCDINGSCRSVIGSSVTVNVANTPSAPTAVSASPSSGCAPLNTVLSGTCASGNIEWYVTAGGTGSGIGNNPTITSTTVFYAKCVDLTNPTGCQYSTAVPHTVSVTTAPSNPVSLTADKDTICPAENVILTASGCTSFEWYTNPAGTGTPLATNSGTLTVNPLTTTTYYVFCEDAGCLSTGYRSVKVVVDSCSTTGVRLTENFSASLYPNPFVNEVTLSINDNSQNYYVQVVNVQGKLIKEFRNINSGKNDLSLTDLEKGVYLFNILNDNGELKQTIRMTKN